MNKQAPSAGRILTRTGSHATDLAATVEKLPALLETAKPALERLGALSEAGIPLLAQLHRRDRLLLCRRPVDV